MNVVILDDETETERLKNPAKERVRMVSTKTRVSSHLDVDGVAEGQPVLREGHLDGECGGEGDEKNCGWCKALATAGQSDEMKGAHPRGTPDCAQRG